MSGGDRVWPYFLVGALRLSGAPITPAPRMRRFGGAPAPSRLSVKARVLTRVCSRKGGVAGAAVAAGVSYYMTASALAALAEERALRREEAEPRGGTPHARRGKHASFTAPSGTPGKHKHHHERASEQARRAVASAAELASRVGASDGEDNDGVFDDEYEEDAAAEANDAAELSAPAGVLSNLEYAQRVLADDALPSRAATRFTAALGQTPETPHAAGSGNAYGVYGDASGDELDVSEAASGLETGLETEEERSGALRRRRRDDAAAASGRLLACKAGRTAEEDGTVSSDTPTPLMPPTRPSPKRASALNVPEIAAWSLGPSAAPPPAPANFLSGMPLSVSRTASGVSSAVSAPAPSARPSSAFRVRRPFACVFRPRSAGVFACDALCVALRCSPALRQIARMLRTAQPLGSHATTPSLCHLEHQSMSAAALLWFACQPYADCGVALHRTWAAAATTTACTRQRRRSPPRPRRCALRSPTRCRSACCTPSRSRRLQAVAVHPSLCLRRTTTRSTSLPARCCRRVATCLPCAMA